MANCRHHRSTMWILAAGSARMTRGRLPTTGTTSGRIQTSITLRCAFPSPARRLIDGRGCSLRRTSEINIKLIRTWINTGRRHYSQYIGRCLNATLSTLASSIDRLMSQTSRTVQRQILDSKKNPLARHSVVAELILCVNKIDDKNYSIT